MNQEKPSELINATLREIGGMADWRGKLWSSMRLALICFSLVFSVMIIYELTQVHAAQSWRAQPARLISVTLEAPARLGREAYWRYGFELTETGERGYTTDLRPGDMPMSFLLWSTASLEAARFRPGQPITIYRAPKGGKAYLERGGYALMAATLGSLLAFWAYLFWRRRPMRS